MLGILAALALPNYVKLKDKAKEAETKAALHNLQLVLERWAVDNGGDYPPYLIGGDNTDATALLGHGQNPSGFVEEVPLGASSDVLIRDGYLDAYPRNPFVRNGNAVHKLQVAIGDPLRNASPMASMFGTRFGPYGSLMGSVLCDARWMTRPYTDPAGRQCTVDTFSSIQYEFYDIWIGNLQKPFLPGSFMYKAMGEIVPTPGRRDHLLTFKLGDTDASLQQDTRDRATYPIGLSQYMLGAWGAFHTAGMDILGEEPLVLFSYSGSRRSTYSPGAVFDPATGALLKHPPSVDFCNVLGVPPWTRGVNRAHVGPLWGSPYGVGDCNQQMSYGNPNGMRDAIIMVLTAEAGPGGRTE